MYGDSQRKLENMMTPFQEFGGGGGEYPSLQWNQNIFYHFKVLKKINPF